MKKVGSVSVVEVGSRGRQGNRSMRERRGRKKKMGIRQGAGIDRGWRCATCQTKTENVSG
jgi:hypothetical protein